MNKLIILVLLLLLTACATVSRQLDWPAGIPTQAYYEAEYAADLRNQGEQSLSEYLSWNIRFYQGWALYRRGWIQLMDEVDETLVKPHERALAAEKMASIGKRVSSEWSKADKYRRINTGNVSVWGNSLVTALLEGDALSYISRVDRDVDDLLAGTLLADEITLQRYYPDDPEDVFN